MRVLPVIMMSLAAAFAGSMTSLNAQEAQGAKTPPFTSIGPMTLVSAKSPGNQQNGGSSQSSLPDAPQAQNPQRPEDSKISASGKLPAILAPQMTRQRLTAHDKFALYRHQAVNPVALLLPAVSAGFSMANPPKHYPHDWRAGGEAFGRLYGDALARRESGQAAQFLTAATFREDHRYLPSASHNTFGRVAQALTFTLIDTSDSGHRMPALSNFAGAAAKGFVGTAYLPAGYNDLAHAGQRSAITFAGFAAGNLVNEFCPEWGPLVNRLHIPFVHPPCPDKMRNGHP